MEMVLCVYQLLHQYPGRLAQMVIPVGCRKEWGYRSDAMMVIANGTVCAAQQLTQNDASSAGSGFSGQTPLSTILEETVASKETEFEVAAGSLCKMLWQLLRALSQVPPQSQQTAEVALT